MSIIPLRPLLEAANKYGYAYGAFNVNSISQAEAVIEVHEMFRAGAILQAADLANGFMGGRKDFFNSTIEDKRVGAKRIADAIRHIGEKSKIPIAIHLDHGKDFESVKAAIDGGFTSVMIDGSHLAYDENVELTREIVKYAHPYGVSVEGELGVLAGVEDHVFSDKSTYTNPLKAVDFFKKTGVDALAISYGTMHGANKGKNAKLRKEIAIATMENLKHENLFGMLVSHGSSTVPAYIVEELNKAGGNVQNAYGIPVDELVQVIPAGIGKINVDTDLRLAVTRNIREFFKAYPDKQKSASIGEIYRLMEMKPEAFDPRYYLTPIMDTLLYNTIPDEDVRLVNDLIKAGVKEVVATLVVKFGGVGYGPKIEKLTLEDMKKRYI